MATTNSTKQKPPAVSETGDGYRYVRCQQGDRDDTVYLHQLLAIADGADPYKVFGDAHDIHHLPLDQVFDLDVSCPSLPWLNLPGGCVPRPRWDHRESHLEEVNG